MILVDLDVRKPSLAGFFSLAGAEGLTTVVLGQVVAEEVLVPISVRARSRNDGHVTTGGSSTGTVKVLPVGPLPPNPAEFVGSRALAELLAELEPRADLILVDAPPILNLSDTMTLSARVDGLVVVTRLPFVKRSVLLELNHVLSAAPAAKLGFVLTGAAEGPGLRGIRIRIRRAKRKRVELGGQGLIPALTQPASCIRTSDAASPVITDERLVG